MFPAFFSLFNECVTRPEDVEVFVVEDLRLQAIDGFLAGEEQVEVGGGDLPDVGF